MVSSKDEAHDVVKEALFAADELCTAVVNGKSGLMQVALKVARALDDVRRTQPEKLRR